MPGSEIWNLIMVGKTEPMLTKVIEHTSRLIQLEWLMRIYVAPVDPNQ